MPGLPVAKAKIYSLYPWSLAALGHVPSFGITYKYVGREIDKIRQKMAYWWEVLCFQIARFILVARLSVVFYWYITVLMCLESLKASWANVRSNM